MSERRGLGPHLMGQCHRDRTDHSQQDQEDQKAPHHTLERISVALVPPNPKLLDMATLTSCFLAFFGTKSITVVTLGFSKLMVGGTIPSRIARRQKIASTDPAAPRRWPMADLVEDMGFPGAALPMNRSTAPTSMPSAMVEVPWALI